MASPYNFEQMTYEDKLHAAKTKYPFARWHKGLEHGLEQYPLENCDKMERVFDDLIADLALKGEAASVEDKVESFRVAIESTNEIADETDMVETGEREDLCELTNVISGAAGLDFKDYGGGEGLASVWRDW